MVTVLDFQTTDHEFKSRFLLYWIFILLLTVSEVALEFWRTLKYGLNFKLCFWILYWYLLMCMYAETASEIPDHILRSSRILKQLQKLLLIISVKRTLNISRYLITE